jgi:hypothetical protein
MPPLTISLDQLAEGLDLLEQAISDEFSEGASVDQPEIVENAA